MPSLIEGESREAVKRAVPKSSNKIHAGAIARLYIAYPDRQRWTYTGLQGAVMLANDLVGHTFWLKMVDISGSNRGVIWDQEIYDTFQYNQDRVFFHTFELEKCMAGLSFVDDKEAKTFKKKMDEREKNAHRKTKEKAFGTSAGRPEEVHAASKSHGILGGLGGKLFGHRSSSATYQPQTQSNVLPTDSSSAPPSSPLLAQGHNEDIMASLDPTLLKELKDLGLDEDQIRGNAGFIRDYVEQRRQDSLVDNSRSKAPPPPQPLTPQDTGNTSSSRRGPAPAPPPARRGGGSARPPSPPPDSDEVDPTPRGHHSTFKVPVFTGAGKFAADAASSSPIQSRADSGAAPTPGPPPPPRPPKTPLEDEETPQIFGVPPPFTGSRKPVPPARGPVPPPPPTRNTGPPPPPSRDTSTAHSVPPAAVPPPPLPPKTPHVPEPLLQNRNLPPPPPPARDNDIRSVPPPPPTPASTAPRPNIIAPPPPPPPSQPSLPSRTGPPAAPPPPPMPSQGGAPPPPPPPPPASSLPPGMEPVTANAPSLPSGGGDRGGLLADIRGGARLKKVSEKEKNDRSAAPMPGASSGGGAASGGSAATSGGDTGLAGALANALAKRKEKVAHSDDEDDKDDW